MRHLWMPFGLAVVLGLGLAAPAAEDKAAKDNTPPEGFTALFNGKDLTNWQAAVDFGKRLKMSPEELAKAQKAANDKVLSHWTVKDGVLNYDGKGGSLATVKDYGNFEL